MAGSWQNLVLDDFGDYGERPWLDPCVPAGKYN